jgi:hypothetical protein
LAFASARGQFLFRHGGFFAIHFCFVRAKYNQTDAD